MAGTQDLDTAIRGPDCRARSSNHCGPGRSEQFQLAAHWAAMHSTDSITDAAVAIWEGEVPIAGEGAPLVAEFCVAEFALAIGKSTDAGRRYLGDAVEVRYRLPKIWKLVTTGALPVWRAQKIAQATVSLPMEGAAYVDRHVAPTAARLTPAQLERAVDDARTRFDPAAAEERRIAAAESRHFDIYAHQVSYDGTVDLDGTLDLADALDLEDVVAAGARQLADLGCTESLDVRRSMAVGALARGQAMLPVVEEVAQQPSRNHPARSCSTSTPTADPSPTLRTPGPCTRWSRSATGAATPPPPSTSAKSSTSTNTAGPRTTTPPHYSGSKCS